MENLLSTKLLIPQFPENLVSRPRLIDILDQGEDRKLTLISAPAGYGKTTLLSEWIDHRAIPTCWFSLDQRDNDLGRFLAYLIASFQSINIEIDEQILTILQSRQKDKLEALLIPLINQISDSDSRHCLVLDDYHLIQSQEVHNTLAYFLDHLPPNMRLVIATRADPPLPLARMRARGQLIEIRAQHLRFSLDEGAAFLNQALDHGLSETSIQSLIDRTEGWISALQMAVLSLRFTENPSSFIETFAGSHYYIFDYLTDEVLRHQPEAVKRFLLRTSILDRLSGPLCDAVTEMGKGQQTLEMLQETNAFMVSLDEGRVWFRYHQLFSDMLQQRLQQEEPENIKTYHKRASVWFGEHGLRSEAIDHAIKAEEFDQAAASIEQAAESTLLRGEISTFLKWVDQLPAKAAMKRPMLSLYHAEALLLSGLPISRVSERMKDAPEHIGIQALMSTYRGDVEKSILLTKQALNELPADSYFIKSAITSALGAILFLRGDVDQAFSGFTESLEYARASNNLLLEVIGTTRKAQLLAISGRVSEASLWCQHALELATDRQGRYRPLASLPLYFWAYLLRERAALETALESIRQAIELSNKYGGFWGIDCYITYALILQDLGKDEEAIEAIHTARKLSRETSANPFDDLYSAAFEAQIWIAQGQLDAATQWARRRNLLSFEHDSKAISRPGFFHMQELEQTTLAHLHIAKRNPDEALQILKPLADAMVRLSRQGSLIENYILQALAYQQKGNRKEAVRVLGRALSLAEPDGAVRLFLNERPAIDPLMKALISGGIQSEFAKKLMANKPPATDKQYRKTPTVGERLSERETEVLRLLVSDLSVPEIAENIHISVSTLRTHIRNIYRKLDTHSRFETVSKAKDLNII